MIFSCASLAGMGLKVGYLPISARVTREANFKKQIELFSSQHEIAAQGFLIHRPPHEPAAQAVSVSLRRRHGPSQLDVDSARHGRAELPLGGCDEVRDRPARLRVPGSQRE